MTFTRCLSRMTFPDFSIRQILSKCYIRSRETISKVSETTATGFTSILRRLALVFSDLDRIWPDLVSAYNGAFRTLVFGPLPPDHLVRQSMKRISDRVAQVAWQINRREG